jgi:hypothetical protein
MTFQMARTRILAAQLARFRTQPLFKVQGSRGAKKYAADICRSIHPRPWFCDSEGLLRRLKDIVGLVKEGEIVLSCGASEELDIARFRSIKVSAGGRWCAARGIEFWH